MFKGFEDVDYTHFFTRSQSQCRGHQYKLYKLHVLLNQMQESSFFQFVLLMCGILCLRSYCSVVLYKRSSVIWTCVCIKAFSSFFSRFHVKLIYVATLRCDFPPIAMQCADTSLTYFEFQLKVHFCWRRDKLGRVVLTRASFSLGFYALQLQF